MPYIPQEILDIIIGYATTAEGPSFSNCASLVSHTFHQITLPYKFRSLTFRNPDPFCGSIIVPKFLKAINAGDAHALSLAPLVQELVLFDWSGYACGWEAQEQFEKIINSVLSFRNLTKVSIVNCGSSPIFMERLGTGKHVQHVQFQSLHTLTCIDEKYPDEYHTAISYCALSNLKSWYTLEFSGKFFHSRRSLAYIPMNNLRILKSDDWEVTEAFLTTDPPVQLEKLQLNHDFQEDYLLLWDYLARVTSLTHLSLPNLKFKLPHPSLIFPLQELQYLHVHVVSASLFADLPMKEMEVSRFYNYFGKRAISSVPIKDLVRELWRGTVFPDVQHLKADQAYDMDSIPFEFWREFLPKLQKVQ